jgi:hypothetical protein
MSVKTPTLMNIPIDANPIEKTLTLTPETPETEEDQEEDIDPNAESAVLNSGAFGCMFFPGIRCNGQLENRHYITKIQKKTHVTDNEMYISQVQMQHSLIVMKQKKTLKKFIKKVFILHYF